MKYPPPTIRRVLALLLALCAGPWPSTLDAAPSGSVPSFPPVDSEPLGTVSTGALVLYDHWQMREEAIVGNHGETFSVPGYEARDWLPATVPTTTLATLVRNGIYPDPVMGMNMMKIPDADATENKHYDLLKYSHLPDHSNPFDRPFWFRTSLTVPAGGQPGRVAWLHLDGINYRADVWLNGQQIANSQDVVGMFKRFRFDVSKFVRTGGAANVLAVRIHPLDIPGDPVAEQLGGVTGGFGPNSGDKQIMKNVSMYQTVGWDWTPSVRDRNVGLWQHVWLEETGPVAVRDPAGFVDLKWQPGQDAPVKVRGYLDNPGAQPVRADLAVRIEPQGFAAPTVEFHQTLSAAAGRNEFTLLPADHPELVVRAPHVWWPVTYGDHPLYKLTVTCSVADRPSSSAASLLGIRTVGTFVLPSGGPAFTCNGRTIRLTGGAWIPDTMLSWSAQRYRDEVRLMAQGNHTVVRVNGCGIMPPDVFFDACDRDGLLVWEDFSRTSPRNSGQADSKVLMDNMTDCVDRMRGHPSLLLWNGSNETLPQQDWAQPMQDQVLPAMDGTRPWIPSSGESAPWSQPTHMASGGPYGQVPLRTLFDSYAKSLSYVCKNEVGMACPMGMNAIARSIPDWAQPTKESFPLNQSFGFHDATDKYYRDTHNLVAQQFGPMPDLMEYLWAFDLHVGSFYRGVFEAANKARPRNAGTHLWKVNTAWPSMMWQLWDWYLRPNSGYYGMKEACRPLHVQYSLDDDGVQVVSTLPDALRGLRVRAEIVSLTGTAEFDTDSAVDAAADATTAAGSLAGKFADGHVRFLALTLVGADGKVLDRDVRFTQKDGNWGELQTLAPALVVATVKETHNDGAETAHTVLLENTSAVPACDAYAQILAGVQGKEILPCFWTDNALTLLPHEKREVVVRYRTALLAGAQPHLLVEGFNVMPREIGVADGKPVSLSVRLVSCEAVPVHTGKPTVKLALANMGAAGPRYTSWPIPVSVDGKIARYVHVDVLGQEPSPQLVSFAGLTGGSHDVTAGDPKLAKEPGSVKLAVKTLQAVSYLPAPVKALASSESKQREAGHLFDGKLSPDSLGSDENLGGSYQAAEKDYAPVIWTDYGKPINANALAYAPLAPAMPGTGKVTAIKLWFYEVDPGTGTAVPTMAADETVALTGNENSLLKRYAFRQARTGRYVVMQLVGQEPGSPGGSELRLVAPEGR